MKRKLFLGLFGAAVVFAALSWHAALGREAEVRIAFLDVGQGDAIFIALPDGHQILIDGGPDATVLHELSEVMPPWDYSLDMVIATHPDADHLAGLIDVLERYEVATVVETGMRKDNQLSRAWEEALQQESADIVLADGPKRIRFSDAAVIDLLWPQRSHAGEVNDKPNDKGVVGQFTYGTTSFLFTADIERVTEGFLVQSGILQDVDVLKVAHHGSKTSTSEAFLALTKPEFAVVSVGNDNRYGHPHPSVLDRLARRAIHVLRTDQDGRVTFTSDGQKIKP